MIDSTFRYQDATGAKLSKAGLPPRKGWISLDHLEVLARAAHGRSLLAMSRLGASTARRINRHVMTAVFGKSSTKGY